MAYWWVNHDDMYAAELGGNYIWCPQNTEKSKRVGYANLTLVEKGDIVFSYAQQKVSHVGTVMNSYEIAPRPADKGYSTWDRGSRKDGWRVPIAWEAVAHPISPKQHIDKLGDYFGRTHGALRETGDGKQSMYPSAVPRETGDALARLLNVVVKPPTRVNEGNELEKIRRSLLPETTKKALVDARIGQGRFRTDVIKLHKCCPITGVADSKLLIASHIKAWKAGTNEERLDPNNGLLLAPHIDKLFDRGFISFSDLGEMLVFNDDIRVVLDRWQVPISARLTLNPSQRNYMAHHRKQHKFK